MVDAPSDRPHTLKITRIFDTPRQAVFEAWTNPDYVKQWLCPEDETVVRAELDVRVGGAFRVDMRSGQEITTHTGAYREIISPEKLVFTWASTNTYQQETLVTVELFEHGDKTELVLTQTQLPDEQTVEGHTQGWTKIFEHLKVYLQNNRP